MKREIIVPEVSEGVTEGTVVDLAVAVGDQVEQGETITITRRGRPVARLAPGEDDDRRQAREAVERLISRRREIKGVSIEEIIRMKHEGHRY